MRHSITTAARCAVCGEKLNYVITSLEYPLQSNQYRVHISVHPCDKCTEESAHRYKRMVESFEYGKIETAKFFVDKRGLTP